MNFEEFCNLSTRFFIFLICSSTSFSFDFFIKGRFLNIDYEFDYFRFLLFYSLFLYKPLLLSLTPFNLTKSWDFCNFLKFSVNFLIFPYYFCIISKYSLRFCYCYFMVYDICFYNSSTFYYWDSAKSFNYYSILIWDLTSASSFYKSFS